jgi:DNA polymerase I-like protein with 3'-5' exonuclease and polymerase domains
MPLVNADVKGLEVVVAAELSGDKVLRQEILDKVDIHETNRDRFQLGEGKAGRLIAKIFKFRLIYGGSAFSYANDADFKGVSTSVKFWQDIIDSYYSKYVGIKEWHERLIQTAQTTGRITIPSGRFFPFVPSNNKWGGGLDWPITTIKNYPVQGFGADLVMLARLEAHKRLKASGVEYALVSTIHDSIVVDTPSGHVGLVAELLRDSVEAVPALCKQVFGYPFSLPLNAEVQYGPNKKDMNDVQFRQKLD